MQIQGFFYIYLHNKFNVTWFFLFLFHFEHSETVIQKVIKTKNVDIFSIQPKNLLKTCKINFKTYT